MSDTTKSIFLPFHETITNVASVIVKHAEQLNRPVIGIMPAYFPMEIAYAAGGYPVQLWGNNLPLGKSDAYLQAFCCSMAKSVMELELIDGASMVRGYVFTSLCDTLINLREMYRRVFDRPTVEFSIPATNSDSARYKYLKIVLDQVIEGLEEMTGSNVSDESLKDASERYARVRNLQRILYEMRLKKPGIMKSYDFYAAIKSGFFLPPDVYADMLDELISGLDKSGAEDLNRKILLLTGMYMDPIGIYKDVFDALDIDIVDDDFANGWRSVSKGPLNVKDLTEGVLEYVYNPAPCCCIFNPGNDRHKYLIEKVKSSGADGVLFWYQKFCEPDAFERPQLMEALKRDGIQATFFEVELSMRNFAGIKTRVSAFCEMLED